MSKILKSSRLYRLLNPLVTIGSALLCLLLLPTRLPGMELLGVAPHWTLIWVVSWSLNHKPFQGAIAGGIIGLIQNGMLASAYPSHAVSLAIVGALTSRIRQQQYLRENSISVALIVFGMTIIAQTIMAFQYSLLGIKTLAEIWLDYQRIALSSAILSSLWTPVLYYPLHLWWQQIKLPKTSSRTF